MSVETAWPDPDVVSYVQSVIDAAGTDTAPVIPKITVGTVLNAACLHFKVSKIDMVSERRSRHLVYARQAAMYISREVTPRSLQQIGNCFGGRDHTTVIHAIKAVEAKIADGGAITSDLDALRGRLPV